MDIVLCTDNNYAMPCGVTMISLLENNKNNSATFHIVGMDLSDGTKDILSSISKQYGASLFFYEVQKSLLQKYDLSLYESEHLSIAAYSRLFLADILPNDIDKVLYLDCDIIVSKDLSELWNTDIRNCSVAGVVDIYLANRKKPYGYLGYDSSYSYINSGVLLINLKYWRENNLSKIFLDYVKEKRDELKFHDQDIINGTLYDSKMFLPITYNMIEYYYLNKAELGKYKEEIVEALKDPAIIHFTSYYKPWKKVTLHPMRNEFDRYKAISPWKDLQITWENVPTSKKIQYYRRKLLYFLKLQKHKYIQVHEI